MNAYLGGIVIGLAVAVLWLGIGRIAGVSGIVSRLNFVRTEYWRWGFVGGVLLSGFAATALLGWKLGDFNPQNYAWWWLALAAFLVGFGTVLGSGCTSGHGICGMARLSKRSITATALFMLTAMATVTILRHVWGG
ncbi:YeeE/YedE family protein [Testudinibacter sp. TR-2022]|uniref:YeeE/YedE family protein n=1 Tax=Testudinibacter sp. TR-2022 TaxID=2585029 RepID=UPI001117E611|nr:YeeE/YedE family protein [Testudinibacter sp. TR-2022]TNH06765.1 YeeE/YedE family protein [Pasteurellaceae bacterium Phil11]TNH22518.1 YeeE/YedE family protein [Testudinibacter sp. TR-2022]TNH28266.1 YeeE/YedE family protein [Testudinibacter sp. TR-2022]